MAFYQFPGSNFHDLNLDWLLSEMKNCLAEWATTKADWQALQANYTSFHDAIEAEWDEMKQYINNYFNNLDVTDEVRTIINEMAEDGSLLNLIEPFINESIATWLAEHITQETGYVIDTSLTVSGAAADAKTVGDALADTVHLSSQAISTGDQAQARENIGAASVDATKPIATLNIEWEQGTIDGTTGNNANQPTRIRSINANGDTRYVRAESSGVIRSDIPTGYKYSIRFYSTPTYTTYIGASKWLGADDRTPVTAGQYLRFVCANDADTSFTPQDAPIFSIYVENETMNRIDGITETGNNLLAGRLQHYGIGGGKLVASSASRAYCIPVSGGETYTVSRASTASPDRLRVGFLKTDPADGVDVYTLEGTKGGAINTEAKGMFDGLTEKTFTVPDGCTWCVLYISNIQNEPDDETALMLVRGTTAEAWSPINTETAVDEIARDGANDIISRNDPVGMLAKLQQANRPTRTGSRTLGTPPLCLIHFSDIHGDEYCLRNIATFHNHYKSMIADVLHTGDTVTGYSGDGIAFWDNVTDAAYYLNTIGNHDMRSASSGWTNPLSAASCRDMYFNPYISNWGVTIGSGVCYYYKDYTANSVRLIVLDAMHDDATQRTWFANLLSDASEKGLHVLCAAHCMPSKQLTAFQTPWDDKPAVEWYDDANDFPQITGNNYPEWLDSSYVDAVTAFQNGGGDFVCWLYGHLHCAMFAKIRNTNQLCVGVGNAGASNFAWTYSNARQQGSKNADDFNVIAIDTVSRALKIIKVGVDYNRLMMHKDTISYNYGTGVIITD